MWKEGKKGSKNERYRLSFLICARFFFGSSRRRICGYPRRSKDVNACSFVTHGNFAL